MGLIEAMNSCGGCKAPKCETPVVISCDYETLPGNKMDAILELIKVARFQARFIDAKEAYVVLKNVRDNRTAEEFFNSVIDAYVQSEPTLRYLSKK